MSESNARSSWMMGIPISIHAVLGGAGVFVFGSGNESEHRLDIPRRIAQGPVGIQRKFEQMLPNKDDLFSLAENAKVRTQSQVEGVVTQDPIAKSVEGADPRIGIAIRDQHVNAFFHLGCRLVGEREREDLRRPYPPCCDEPRNATCDDLSLAGPGAGDDEQRTCFVSDRAMLRVVEIGEDLVDSARRLTRYGSHQFQGQLTGLRRAHDRGTTLIGHQSSASALAPKTWCNTRVTTPLEKPRRWRRPRSSDSSSTSTPMSPRRRTTCTPSPIPPIRAVPRDSRRTSSRRRRSGTSTSCPTSRRPD